MVYLGATAFLILQTESFTILIQPRLLWGHMHFDTRTVLEANNIPAQFLRCFASQNPASLVLVPFVPSFKMRCAVFFLNILYVLSARLFGFSVAFRLHRLSAHEIEKDNFNVLCGVCPSINTSKAYRHSLFPKQILTQ